MKKRLDVLLVERGLATSREKAKAMIMAGEVLVDNEREDKAGSMFPEEVEIVLKGKPLPYVSRGGLKLEKAMKTLTLPWMERSAWMSEHPPAALPTVCCRTAPSRYIPWMSATASSTGSCGTIRALSAWSARTSVTSCRRISRRDRPSYRSTYRLSP